MGGAIRQVMIRGRVQGVGYRAWAEAAARTRGLSGWVRNRRDGSVEVLIPGPAEKVDEMVAYFWQGPAASRVER
ncbi:MAG: acylphosphatase, partial [Tardiphaga sp.]|nr:acylphosphatase [Tardiphaga sp.]